MDKIKEKFGQKDFVSAEEEVLGFWKKNRIFEKSLERRKKSKKFCFFEGPPFANGLPGIHHLLSRAVKDVILRYKTMRGFFVERRAGWDTHGLPTEMETEKKLGIKTKKEIEKLGIKKFIKLCRESVFIYKKEWEEFTERIAFWLDLKNAYITCSNDYIESLWWILKQIWNKGLLYQDYKVVPYCPRCGTSLSSHEVAQGYKKIKEPAIYVKLKLKTQNSKLKTTTKNLKLNTHLLIWTTTPWTLPGNAAVAVNPKFTYVKVKIGEELFILAKERLDVLGKEYIIIEEFKGKDLIGLEYQSLFTSYKPEKGIWFIISGDFVSLEQGTGLVHIAPAFGEDDMTAFRQQIPNSKFQIPKPVDEQGRMTTPGYKWNKMFVQKANPLIIEDLRKRKLLYKEELYEHDYPFCWRCESPLLYYAKTSWFIKTTAVKKELITHNEQVNWVPEHIKNGRFGEWLKEVKDWNLSRERYWGTPLPIWQCQIGKNQKSKIKNQKCDNVKIIGSIKELEKLSGKKISDLHRPIIDEITFKCEKCGKRMKRVAEVVDCWFDSGAMPFAQGHWPFAQNQKSKRSNRDSDQIKNQKFKFPKQFPADYISEGIDQTRGWFYTLLAVSTLLGFGPPYKNVISSGLVLDEYGRKMSKSKGNVVDPVALIQKYGADVLRWYFYTVNPIEEPKRFAEKDLEKISRRFFLTFYNSYNFLKFYGKAINKEVALGDKKFSYSLLDKWLLARLNEVILGVKQDLDDFQLRKAAKKIEDLIDDLSRWYIRRSRSRFQQEEKVSFLLHFFLQETAKISAPFIPFFSEALFLSLTNNDSVHLKDFPKQDKNLIDEKLVAKMKKIRELAAQILMERDKAGLKVRQPLAFLKIKNQKLKIKDKELLDLLKEEVNVKKIIFDSKIKSEVELDTKITKELKEEGILRELVRLIQGLRKKAGLEPKDKIILTFASSSYLKKILKKEEKNLKKKLGIISIEWKHPVRFQAQGDGADAATTQIETKIENDSLRLGIRLHPVRGSHRF